ncbi:hypothetical protein MVEN_00632000 [Mycena venus]|uniref:Uncharacterized protein n=1 Tax=Mycena venus TaxID=2733690 RepID=A0A8H6YPL4_9AGAR|nr:hypothetical protein MVEN_00632000 [Mycena venus]
MEPVFPPELEREIFETAAVRDPDLIPTLLRVCHRVHAWVEPLLYRVLIIPDSITPQLAAVQSKPTPFLQNAVRHVLIVYISSDYRRKEMFNELLSNLSGIISLFLDGYIEPDILPVLDKMRLQKLNLSVPDSPGSQWARLTLTHSLFLSVTHLELYWDPDEDQHISWEDWSHLATLAALTHLCLSKALSVDILQPTVTNCPRLVVVITAFWSSADAWCASAFAQALTITDPRIVVLVVGDFKEDWEAGARRGEDFWTRAEAFVVRKHKGEIERNCYLCEESTTGS